MIHSSERSNTSHADGREPAVVESELTTPRVQMTEVRGIAGALTSNEYDLVKSLREDAASAGLIVTFAMSSPTMPGLVLPDDPGRGSVTWTLARRLRRFLSLADARLMALESLQYAQDVRDRAAEEEARRSHWGEIEA